LLPGDCLVDPIDHFSHVFVRHFHLQVDPFLMVSIVVVLEDLDLLKFDEQLKLLLIHLLFLLHQLRVLILHLLQLLPKLSIQLVVHVLLKLQVLL